MTPAYRFLTELRELKYFVHCYGKAARLSAMSVACAKKQLGLYATTLINGLFKCLFYLALGKVCLVNMGLSSSPEFWTEKYRHCHVAICDGAGELVTVLKNIQLSCMSN